MRIISGLPFFLTGLGVGLTFGIHFAPRSGDESRRLIGQKAKEGKDVLKTAADQGQDYIKRRGTELRDQANELIGRGKDALNRQKEQLSRAVEAGKEAYRSPVDDPKTLRDAVEIGKT